MSGQKYPRSEAINNLYSETSYVSWQANDAEGMGKALAGLDSAVGEYSGRVHASHRLGFDPGSIGGSGISGRYGMTNQDYESWRPGERSHFFNAKEAMIRADYSYRQHGLIKNVIDLMGDFASQGIRLVHPNPRIQRFFNNWFRRVQGKERSERFLNCLYRLGNVVLKVQTATINPTMRERLFKTAAKPDMDATHIKVTPNEIPWKYTFLHPATVEVVGGALANFSGKPRYAIKLPNNLRRTINQPRNSIEKKLVADLPDDIKSAAKNQRAFPLPEDKTKVFHYKKDDWQEWADPMLASLALDISLYEKLKLADRAALDGAISNIRIFKLGNLEYKIVPTDKAAAKLASILESNTQAGTLDLIWGPDIELIESNTNVHQFLGLEKYEPTLIAIYAGLGIPPTLTGTFGAAGTTNNFVSLKTLTQRLEYGRDMLVQFWGEQIRQVQEAMGFRFPATIEFDYMNLGDEVAEKSLLIQLADRNLISDELLQRHFGNDPDMERIRMQRESKERDRDARPDKAGPFHDPQVEEALKKIFAQTGAVTPSEVGLQLDPKKNGEKSALDQKAAQMKAGQKGPTPAKKGQPGQGRPKNSKDSTTRKTKTFKPKVKAMWAKFAQDVIAEYINPALLEVFGKKNMRSISSEQMEQAEKARFGVLFNLDPLVALTEQNIAEALDKPLPNDVAHLYKMCLQETSATLNRQLTADERKDIQAYIYDHYKDETD